MCCNSALYHPTTQRITYQRWELTKSKRSEPKVFEKPSDIQKIHHHVRFHKNQIVTALQLVFLSPMVYQLIIFGQVSALAMLQNLFNL